MKKGKITLLRKFAAAMCCGLILTSGAYAQVGEPGDYSSAEAVTLNAEDMSGTYVIKCAISDLYLSPLIAPADVKEDGNPADEIVYATDDITNCYAFDISKNEDGSYTVKTGDHLMVWGLTNNWNLEIVAPDMGGNSDWSINVQLDNTVTFERATDPGYFIKYEVNGVNLGLTKFYTDASDGNIYFELLQVSTTSISNPSNLSTNVYPNPASEVLNITNIEAGSELVIVNILGQVVYEQQADANNVTVSVDSWNQGLYLVKVGNRVFRVLVN